MGIKTPPLKEGFDRRQVKKGARAARNALGACLRRYSATTVYRNLGCDARGHSKHSQYGTPNPLCTPHAASVHQTNDKHPLRDGEKHEEKTDLSIAHAEVAAHTASTHLEDIGRGSCAQIFIANCRMLLPSNACRRAVISYRTHLRGQKGGRGARRGREAWEIRAVPAFGCIQHVCAPLS